MIKVHAAAIARLSPALNGLINGHMSEAEANCANLDDVAPATFLLLCEYAYHGDYTPPRPFEEDGGGAPESRKQDDVEVENEPVPGDAMENFNYPRWMPKQQHAKKGKTWGSLESDWPNTVTKDSLSKKAKFRKSFDDKSFGNPSSDIVQQPIITPTSKTVYSSVLLTHGRLYVVAMKYDIASLKTLVLRKIHKPLLSLTLYSSRVSDVVGLLRYIYSDDPQVTAEDDELRKLLVHYVGCEMDTLGNSHEFAALLEEGGAFVRDVWKMVYGHLL